MITETGTLTRKMDTALSGLDKEFTALYAREDFERKINALYQAKGKSNRPSILASLFAMFDACGISYEKRRDDAYYADLVKKSNIPEFSGIEDKMLLGLYQKYQEYPSPDAYMQRIVDRLSCQEDGWDGDTLRVRILKQFIKYGNYLEELLDSNGKKIVGGKTEIRNYVKKKTGKKPDDAEVLRMIDDGIFLAFEQELAEAKSRISEMTNATKAEKKKARDQVKALGKLGGKFGLLKMADDLAAGKFRTEGRTKRCLYWFAMVYHMTYYSGKEGQVFDHKTDIEKNLFQDYYTNNLMRFITDAYQGRLCEYEIDPSGQGINYKNFAEIINLYYIANAYPPQEKIRRSAAMINRVQIRQSRQNDTEQKEEPKETIYFRGFFRADAGQSLLFHEDVLNLTEDAFEQFVCENYDCSTYTTADDDGTTGQKIGELQVAIEQRTAFENYQGILARLKDLWEDDAFQCTLENCNYGLWFTDVSALKKKGCETLCNRNPAIDREKFGEFLELLIGINSFLGYTVSEDASEQTHEQEHKSASRKKTKALFVETPKDITRTSMIVAYYYYYNALHEDDGKDKWKDFGEVFRDFKKGIDAILTQSYYQPLNGKNIFDVLVVFSSYAYINL